jgi:hypothetical protein
MTRDLVLARVGRRSLHPCWVDPGSARDWDLRLVPYEPVDPGTGDWEVGDVVAGPKWSGLREHLRRWDGWREYDLVWMPDDDLLLSQDAITELFAVARRVGLDLFAPALHDASHYAHFITMRNHSFQGRLTGFVEIMMPGFSRGALEELLPTLELTQTGWGWGLDSLWPKLLAYRNVGIVDGVTALHTRPVGQLRDPDLAARVIAESDAILRANDCRQRHVSFAAFGTDGRPLDLSPELFFARLVDGSRHLIERDPRVLTWMVDYQRELFRWPAYPTEGTP